MQDLAAGQIDLHFRRHLIVPLAQAGSIKAYALTSDTRWVGAPDIPTFAEMGLPTLSYSDWFGLFVPGGTPKDIIGKLNAAVVEALADPAVRYAASRSRNGIFPPERQTQEALDALQKASVAKWWPIIKESGIKAE